MILTHGSTIMENVKIQDFWGRNDLFLSDNNVSDSHEENEEKQNFPKSKSVVYYFFFELQWSTGQGYL